MTPDPYVDNVRSKLSYPDKCNESLIAFLVRLGQECDFEVTSDWRGPEKNERIGGSPRSWHMQGRAVDLIRGAWTTREQWGLMASIWNVYFSDTTLPLEIRAAKDHIHVAVLPAGLESTFGVEG